jgi:hypothetical protein
MNAPHADPLTSAQYLIRRATINRKPLRVFLGFHGIGGRRHGLVALTQKAGITASLPNTVIEVAPDADAEKLSEILMDQWVILERARADAQPVSGQAGVGHAWRAHGALRFDRRRMDRERKV